MFVPSIRQKSLRDVYIIKASPNTLSLNYYYFAMSTQSINGQKNTAANNNSLLFSSQPKVKQDKT